VQQVLPSFDDGVTRTAARFVLVFVVVIMWPNDLFIILLLLNLSVLLFMTINRWVEFREKGLERCHSVAINSMIRAFRFIVDCENCGQRDAESHPAAITHSFSFVDFFLRFFVDFLSSARPAVAQTSSSCFDDTPMTYACGSI
jgi:hypothetical protein